MGAEGRPCSRHLRKMLQFSIVGDMMLQFSTVGARLHVQMVKRMSQIEPKLPNRHNMRVLTAALTSQSSGTSPGENTVRPPSCTAGCARRLRWRERGARDREKLRGRVMGGAQMMGGVEMNVKCDAVQRKWREMVGGSWELIANP